MHIIGGLYRNRRLATPKGELTRPTSSRLRESLFNICQSYIEGARFLDLFAGSGAIGFEALSRGANHVLFVENRKEALSCIKSNIKELKVENQANILAGDVFQMLEHLKRKKETFDIIFADPPYQTKEAQKANISSFSERVIHQIAEGELLRPGGMLFIEEATAFQPEIENFEKLKLIDSRKMSGTVLQKWQRIFEDTT